MSQILHQKIATFFINFLIRPALKIIESSLSPKPTRPELRNRKKVLQVLYRIIANMQYDPSSMPWMRPINQLIANKQKQSIAMIKSLTEIDDNFLSEELKVDLYKARFHPTCAATDRVLAAVGTVSLGSQCDTCRSHCCCH